MSRPNEADNSLKGVSDADLQKMLAENPDGEIRLSDIVKVPPKKNDDILLKDPEAEEIEALAQKYLAEGEELMAAEAEKERLAEEQGADSASAEGVSEQTEKNIDTVEADRTPDAEETPDTEEVFTEEKASEADAGFETGEELLSGDSSVLPAAGEEEETNELPFTISAGDADGLAVVLFEKGTRLPAAVRMNFSAPYKTPSAVKFRLYAGESCFVRDNIQIDYLKLSGIRQYNGGQTRISATLNLEKNGDLSIELFDEGGLKKKRDFIELDLAECARALEGKSGSITGHDTEVRESYLVVQKARYTYASAERLLKTERKRIPKETKTLIREKMKELKAGFRKADMEHLTPAQKTAMKTQMMELVGLFRQEDRTETGSES